MRQFAHILIINKSASRGNFSDACQARHCARKAATMRWPRRSRSKSTLAKPARPESFIGPEVILTPVLKWEAVTVPFGIAGTTADSTLVITRDDCRSGGAAISRIGSSSRANSMPRHTMCRSDAACDRSSKTNAPHKIARIIERMNVAASRDKTAQLADWISARLILLLPSFLDPRQLCGPLAGQASSDPFQVVGIDHLAIDHSSQKRLQRSVTEAIQNLLNGTHCNIARLLNSGIDERAARNFVL